MDNKSSSHLSDSDAYQKQEHNNRMEEVVLVSVLVVKDYGEGCRIYGT